MKKEAMIYSLEVIAVIFLGCIAFIVDLQTGNQKTPDKAFLMSAQGQKFAELKKAFVTAPCGTVAVDRDGKITILSDVRYFPKMNFNGKTTPTFTIKNTAYYPPSVANQEAVERKYLFLTAHNGCDTVPCGWWQTLK